MAGDTTLLASAERDVGRALRQLFTERALIELRDQRTLELVALVQEREAEGETDVVEDLRVLGPCDDGARAHDGRQVTVDKGLAREVGDADHTGDRLTLGVRLVPGLDLREDDAR